MKHSFGGKNTCSVTFTEEGKKVKNCIKTHFIGAMGYQIIHFLSIHLSPSVVHKLIKTFKPVTVEVNTIDHRPTVFYCEILDPGVHVDVIWPRKPNPTLFYTVKLWKTTLLAGSGPPPNWTKNTQDQTPRGWSGLNDSQITIHLPQQVHEGPPTSLCETPPERSCVRVSIVKMQGWSTMESVWIV